MSAIGRPALAKISPRYSFTTALSIGRSIGVRPPAPSNTARSTSLTRRLIAASPPNSTFQPFQFDTRPDEARQAFVAIVGEELVRPARDDAAGTLQADVAIVAFAARDQADQFQPPARQWPRDVAADLPIVELVALEQPVVARRTDGRRHEIILGQLEPIDEVATVQMRGLVGAVVEVPASRQRQRRFARVVKLLAKFDELPARAMTSSDQSLLRGSC